MGVLFGYVKPVKYLLGIMSGSFVIMLLSGLASRTLFVLFPTVESIIRLAGSAYILWLAYKTAKSSYQFSPNDSPALGFRAGLLLQAFNPKVWVYGLTLYTTFLAGITNNALLLIISACLLAGIAFFATSTWTIAGALIKHLLKQPSVQKAVNTGLALLLAYTAIELSGVLAKLFPL